MRLSIFLVFFVTGLSFTACKKSSGSSAPTAVPGGKGGSAIIMVIPEHHGSYVDSCTIYIKYATGDAPVSGIYDDSIVCLLKDTTPIAIFNGLQVGSYYLYGLGYHAGFTPPYVKGGLPYQVTKQQDSATVYLPTYSYNRRTHK